MTEFSEVLEQTGVPQNNFMVVPRGGFGLLALHDAKGLRVDNDQRLVVHEISDKDIRPVASAFVTQHDISLPDEVKDNTGALWSVMKILLGNSAPARLFRVTAKGSGTPKITAKARNPVSIDVALVPRKKVTVAFDFLKYPDATGKTIIKATGWDPVYAKLWVDRMNWIYGPQCGVYFEMKAADWVTADVTLSLPLGQQAFLDHVVKKKNPGVELNIFLVGKWAGKADHPRGTTFYEHDACVLDDKPTHPEIPGFNDSDSFDLTMAHEIAHYLRNKRMNATGHHKRENILLSDGIQSTRIDKQLVYDINPP